MESLCMVFKLPRIKSYLSRIRISFCDGGFKVPFGEALENLKRKTNRSTYQDFTIKVLSNILKYCFQLVVVCCCQFLEAARHKNKKKLKSIKWGLLKKTFCENPSF